MMKPDQRDGSMRAREPQVRSGGKGREGSGRPGLEVEERRTRRAFPRRP